ncbi:hypothetical protein AAZV13_15G081800 [Glycine max]|uniref:Dynamin stalk domain-containing protein n=2 Tax=Glycine subgen. Soja TaxID=1462606 RepID=K7MAE3_SOYBN|nr:hypothetical protein GYH30_041784 [Glycine max]RZB63730.1 Dynamin-related protein 4C [Glycine soja]
MPNYTLIERHFYKSCGHKTGEKTLAVVTKADKAPEGLHEKLTANDVNIGLGYVCVRNRIGVESNEAKLFQTHLLLFKIDKSIVGIPVLAQKLIQLQAASISEILLKKINNKLGSQLSELDKLTKNLTSVADAMSAFMHIIGLAKSD